MNEYYVLDAHALLWFLENNPRLGPAAESALSSANSLFGLPTIELCEIMHVVENGKSKIPNTAELLRAINADKRIEVLPLDGTVIDAFSRAGVIPEIHDRLIVATAMVTSQSRHLTALITADHSITNSGIVPVIWR